MRFAQLPAATLIALVASFSLPAQAESPAPRLTIEDAVRLALSRNERARVSDLNVVVAEAGVQHALTAFLPTLAATGQYTQHPSATTPSGQNSYLATASVTLTQPVLNASAFPLLGQAKQTLQGQRAQNVDDKRVLSFDAARGFFAVLSAESALAAANAHVANAKATLDDTKARAAAQLNSTNDVTRAQIDLANAQHDAEVGRGAVEAAYVALEFLVNSKVAHGLVSPDALLAAGKKPVPGDDTLVKAGLAQRPDLESKKRLSTAAHDYADEPLLRIAPVVGVSGTFQLSTTPTLPGGDFYNNESVGATLTWTLYDAGVRYADKRSRDAAASIADLTTDTLARQVESDVRTAVVALRAAQGALVAAETARDAARKNVDETAILYKQGLAKAIELVDANDQRFLAEVAYASADNSLALAYLQLRQSLGLDPLGTTLP